ncbi:hypothetical protein [Jiella sonneratiae]|uniref:Uncharacterized protein n=1 Tax=Jiella sonneratiae TaxID=2816856 RepID=A0ABS3J3H6_9HYPH|nr:hypothetical protein [Jiella sonneratiae]MBO0904217.1 hypothetical protein [Jiella sonneratiae]
MKTIAKFRQRVRREAHRNFDAWDRDMAADDDAIDWLCANRDEALRRLILPIRSEAEKMLAEGVSPLVAAIYLNETEAVLRSRFEKMIVDLIEALRRKLEQ